MAADLQLIIELFEQQFFDRFNTRLEAGASEPVYLPASGDCAWHRLCFREDYISSALHETAHWCIAGLERLKLEDFASLFFHNNKNNTSYRELENPHIHQVFFHHSLKFQIMHQVQ